MIPRIFNLVACLRALVARVVLAVLFGFAALPCGAAMAQAEAPEAPVVPEPAGSVEAPDTPDAVESPEQPSDAPAEVELPEPPAAIEPAELPENGDVEQPAEPAPDAAPRAAEPLPQPEPRPTSRPAAAAASAPELTEPDFPASTGPPAEVLPDGTVMLNFHNASLTAVLEFFSEVTGLVILSDIPIEGRVNVLSSQPVTVAQAMDVLTAVLKQKGYAPVRTGTTLKLVPLADAKVASIPVRSGTDPESLKESDTFITQVIPVRYADAGQLKTDLAPLIPEYADLSANVSTNTLIVTDTAANVRRVMEIIAALDTAIAETTRVRVFPLEYASATSAARLVMEVFQPDETGNTNQGSARQRFLRRFGRGEGNNTPETGARPQTKVTAAADERTNTVVVSAPTDVMPLVETVLRDLDANPAQDQQVFTYYLRNAKAPAVETVLNELFSASNATTGGAANNRNNNRGNANRRGGAAAAAAAAGGADDLVGQVTVVADEDTNSLLVMTSSGNADRVRSILEELDRAVPQVLIKVLLAEVTHDNTKDLGLEFSAINLGGNIDNTAFTDFGLDAASGGLVVRLVETDINATLRLLERVGKLEVLSRPYILTSDNQTAAITVGQEVPFITNSRITDTGQTINTIQYQDIGIILNVTPHINPDGLVIMDVLPEISSLTGTSVPISELVSAPVFAKRSAQTRVAVSDGKTIVIGGLMEDRKTRTVSQVPLLGDIPLLGALFRRTQDTVSKTELLIFLTPHVATDEERLQELSTHEEMRQQVVPQAISPGAYEGHRKGMEGPTRDDAPPPPPRAPRRPETRKQ